ncbi:MAG: hypothetical protein Q7W13_09565 [Bacteroidia bacterium]|nr:hypothetical protein [Bacteroidia bacterium]
MGTIRKRFDVDVLEAGKTASKKFELDKTVKTISGIVLTSDREDLMFFRGEQKIDINGKEIIAENYESKLLMTSLNVPINNKYMDLKNLDPGNGIISVSYTDHNHVLAPFVPYRMTLNVQCEVEDGQN